MSQYDVWVNMKTRCKLSRTIPFGVGGKRKFRILFFYTNGNLVTVCCIFHPLYLQSDFFLKIVKLYTYKGAYSICNILLIYIKFIRNLFKTPRYLFRPSFCQNKLEATKRNVDSKKKQLQIPNKQYYKKIILKCQLVTII